MLRGFVFRNVSALGSSIFYTDNAIGISPFANHDWQIEFTRGASVTAVGWEVFPNLTTDIIRVYDANANEIASFNLAGGSAFLGLITDRPVSVVRWDDDPAPGGATLKRLIMGPSGSCLDNACLCTPSRISTFDAGSESWGSNVSQEVSWSSTGGNPGGYMRFVDATGNPSWITAPPRFLGSWLGFEGGILSYDHSLINTGSNVNNILPYRVEISGPGGVAESLHKAPSGVTNWTTISTPLVETSWTVLSGTWTTLLVNVTSLSIRIEHVGNSGGSNVEGIDNVALIPPRSHQLLTSGDAADSVPIEGVLSKQIASVRSGPPTLMKGNPIRHADLHERSSFCCGDGSTTVLMAGEDDDFHCPTDVSVISPHVRAAFERPLIRFDLIPGRNDCCGDDRCEDDPVPYESHSAHRFTGFPECANGATLEIRVRSGPGNATQTDRVFLAFANENGLQTAWLRYIGCHDNQRGIIEGIWPNDRTDTLTLDLTDLKLLPGEYGCTGQINSCGILNEKNCRLNLLPRILEEGFLDVIVGDDSGVDWMKLTFTQDTDFTDEPYVDSTQYLDCADEVTLNNCDSAWYRFTFDFAPWCFDRLNIDPSCNVRNARLAGTANVDDQGVAYLNGHRISGLMNNPGCNPDPANGPDDPCYALQDTGHDPSDADGRRILTAPTPDPFGTDDPDGTHHAGYFEPGENELIFGVIGDASYWKPTGLEFKAEVKYDLLGDCELDGDLDLQDAAEFLKVMTGPK